MNCLRFGCHCCHLQLSKIIIIFIVSTLIVNFNVRRAEPVPVAASIFPLHCFLLRNSRGCSCCAPSPLPWLLSIIFVPAQSTSIICSCLALKSALETEAASLFLLHSFLILILKRCHCHCHLHRCSCFVDDKQSFAVISFKVVFKLFSCGV